MQKLGLAVAMGLALLSGTAMGASAVSYDGEGRYGYQLNTQTLGEAVQRSVQYCSRKSPMCGNLVYTKDSGFSAIVAGKSGVGVALAAESVEQAISRAKHECEAKTEECQVDLVWRETVKTHPQDLTVPFHPLPPMP